VTTPTNATSCSAYVLGEHRYLTEWIEALGSAGVAARVAPGCRRLRSHARDLLGIDVPILACAGDQLAGAVGLGCLDAGQSMCLHGTGSFVDLVIGPTCPRAAGSRTAR
jgi:glycerol kinase